MSYRIKVALVAVLALLASLLGATPASAATVNFGAYYVNNFWTGSNHQVYFATTGSCLTQIYTHYLSSSWSSQITSIRITGALSCNSLRIHQKSTRFGVGPNWMGLNCIGPSTMINLDAYRNDNVDAITWRYTAGCAVG